MATAAAANNNSTPLLDAVEAWSRNTLALGACGAALGALRAAISGSPLGLLAFSTGANSIVLGGAYLALRAGAEAREHFHEALRKAAEKKAATSSGAGALSLPHAPSATTSARRTRLP